MYVIPGDLRQKNAEYAAWLAMCGSLTQEISLQYYGKKKNIYDTLHVFNLQRIDAIKIQASNMKPSARSRVQETLQGKGAGCFAN